MRDVTAKLRKLMATGFRFVHPRDHCGHVVAVTGVRTHNGVVDVIQIYGEQAADAARMSATEPDILSPRSVVWRTSGTALDVLDAMLALPDPDGRTAPAADSRGCWVSTRPGRATWLTASA
ncbi:MAG TPA: hypothetical protein VFW65_20940 [Pseudonocardiaceae bacterium]|nr:hypothetical protein [Pseudonocardiaceae bacterium]